MSERKWKVAKSPKIRWKKNPCETGMRAVGSGPRGHKGRVGDEEIASVYPSGGDWHGPLKGWYFVIRTEGALYNSCNAPLYSSDDEAKAACQAHYEEARAALQRAEGEV